MIAPYLGVLTLAVSPIPSGELILTTPTESGKTPRPQSFQPAAIPVKSKVSFRRNGLLTYMDWFSQLMRTIVLPLSRMRRARNLKRHISGRAEFLMT